jgi:hypothetical protein
LTLSVIIILLGDTKMMFINQTATSPSLPDGESKPRPHRRDAGCDGWLGRLLKGGMKIAAVIAGETIYSTFKRKHCTDVLIGIREGGCYGSLIRVLELSKSLHRHLSSKTPCL